MFELSWLFCFPLRRCADHTPIDSESLADKAYVKSCVFCNVSKETGFNILWEDHKFIAFYDRNPACRHHVQLIPKTHIRSIKYLTKDDVQLVRDMADIGMNILSNLDIPKDMRRMGFHIPPFNSVNHLHLHLQGLPYKNFIRAAKYPVVQGGEHHDKGFSHFVEVEQAIRILEKGHGISLSPC
ncbi:HIT-like protein [Guyanagaster necrorhizus]|uniref:HIT-like protein n=1 Tax=Guyanagaster necrorhizus TaxID=856835 RepID=A0A9P7VQ92_9AGAR|nr:HIT-like protein [Guyanagaster necrorhizus MCA 3950]KAG7444700.1 HIT-like protein [Guyanagaster necrorhizus MCA 3950]